MVIGRHVFFAMDNLDFSEDTADGKCTFHGTAMAMYQRIDLDDKMPDLNIDTPDQSRSIRELPDSIANLLECPKPPSKPTGTVYQILVCLQRMKFQYQSGGKILHGLLGVA